jgi:hypothetical protein
LLYPIHAPDITSDEVLRTIERISPDKAPGLDQITNRVLRVAAKTLADLLANLFNNCYRQGHYPLPFCYSTTVVLRKPGKSDYTITKSFPPIALLNTIGKILDSILASRIAYLAERCKLLPSLHMGGRATSGCEHAVHLLLERIYWARRRGFTASLLLMDVQGHLICVPPTAHSQPPDATATGGLGCARHELSLGTANNDQATRRPIRTV